MLVVEVRWIELNSLSWLNDTRTKSIVALLGDVVLLLHNQLQLALPLNVGVLTVLDHVVDRPTGQNGRIVEENALDNKGSQDPRKLLSSPAWDRVRLAVLHRLLSDVPGIHNALLAITHNLTTW